MLIPEWFYLLLISIGITVIGVLWYLRGQWVSLMRVLALLQQHNSAVDRDLIQFLDGICDSLEKVSVCGLHWQLSWFGQCIERELGLISRYEHGFDINEGDARLSVKFYVKSSRWEQSFYIELLRQQLEALCALDMALKMRQVNSFEQAVARYQLFLAHDLKNFAQMMMLWQRQVQETKAEEAAAALLRWQKVAPLLGDRAEQLAKRLSAPGEPYQSQSLMAIDLSSVVQRLVRWASVHEVRLNVPESIANVNVLASWSNLDDMAFQLMRNYHQHSDADAVELTIEVNSGEVLLLFCHPMPVSEEKLRRMQEPLWSSSELGLGVGLWQMGQIIERLGGRFAIEPGTQGNVCFHWYFKQTAK